MLDLWPEDIEKTGEIVTESTTNRSNAENWSNCEFLLILFNDVEDIHPEIVCLACFTKLSNDKKQTQKSVYFERL